MEPRWLVRFACAAILAATVSVVMPARQASAVVCPDVEVVFARGTADVPPDFGAVGVSFITALRTQIPGRSIATYPVEYPASADFADRLAFARTVVNGIRNTQSHIESTAANCPRTRIVLGGYSQGAVVAGFATMASLPAGIPSQFAQYQSSIPLPMPPEVAPHVAAVVLFGKPSDRFMRDVGAPPIVIGPLYTPKATEYCVPGDTVCDGSPFPGRPNALHALYSVNGMTLAAAGFAASRL
ncbi:cutinase family protein [Nocardia jiangxiensis]|uniref:Cutinase n=1 Tax=Nocardia jiangxiensis TaxID=282685 RepID=A0ABW6S2K5_9NOCA|nr:cutinase family protein [Nocardia jiangxiensis]